MPNYSAMFSINTHLVFGLTWGPQAIMFIKVVNVLAVRQVKQGTETTRFRTDSTPQSTPMSICSYVSLLII